MANPIQSMDSTTLTDLHLLSPLNSSPRKLPVKRKTPLPPHNNSSALHHNDPDLRSRPPFKFHRIWTEPDEILFLQGLLDSSSQSLSFPRDLNIFYTRFTTSVSQPYSKSQLSEKLRRLRKKWRVISSRLAKGLDISRLSPHDRALFDLSKKLWHPDFSSTSPFGGAAAASASASAGLVPPTKNKLPVRSDLFVKVNLAPSVHVSNQAIANGLNANCVNDKSKVHFNRGEDSSYEDVKLSEVKVEFKENCAQEEDRLMHKRDSDDAGNQFGEIVAKTVAHVFDQSLKDVKLGILEKAAKFESFDKRWRELRVVEMEAFAQRLRLVVEDSIHKR